MLSCLRGTAHSWLSLRFGSCILDCANYSRPTSRTFLALVGSLDSEERRIRSLLAKLRGSRCFRPAPPTRSSVHLCEGAQDSQLIIIHVLHASSLWYYMIAVAVLFRSWSRPPSLQRFGSLAPYLSFPIGSGARAHSPALSFHQVSRCGSSSRHIALVKHCRCSVLCRPAPFR